MRSLLVICGKALLLAALVTVSALPWNSPAAAQSPTQSSGQAQAAAPQLDGTYSDKRYGVPLRYPSVYKLQEGELDSESLGWFGSIPETFWAAGGVRVVTIEAPPDSYPGTDFNAAFVTVSVNPFLTRAECGKFADTVPGEQKPPHKTIGGVDFKGADVADAGMSHQFGGTYYHGFSNGLCYEIGDGLATSGYGAVDGMKKLDESQVFAILGRIVDSLSIPGAKPAASAQVSIESFQATPLAQLSPTGAVRISWDVQAPQPDRIWISATCPTADISILQFNDLAPQGGDFPCDRQVAAKQLTGTLDLEFRNLSGQQEQTSVRLFVSGAPSVSRSLTLDLPPLPTIVVIGGGGQKYFPETATSQLQLHLGQNIEIIGVAFSAHQTLTIGSTVFSVDSAANKIKFVVPDSLSPGEYTLSITNESGRSNSVNVNLQP
jgi:hypothetical protein